MATLSMYVSSMMLETNIFESPNHTKFIEELIKQKDPKVKANLDPVKFIYKSF